MCNLESVLNTLEEARDILESHGRGQVEGQVLDLVIKAISVINGDPIDDVIDQDILDDLLYDGLIAATKTKPAKKA